MILIWNGIKFALTIAVILILVFTSTVFGVLLFQEMRENRTWVPPVRIFSPPRTMPMIAVQPADETSGQKQEIARKSALLDAPVFSQFPELPAGCEVVSLTMLFHYYGIDKSKLELAQEMKVDPTPIVWENDGTIRSWGNPNTGYVGDITKKQKAFGIYHGPMFELMKTYIPTAVDLTEKEFAVLERQIAEGSPVVAWTTINFRVPERWVVWQTASGPVKTTFMEHAVLLVGYDEKAVYVNDPWTGKKNLKIDKEQFVSSWEAMGKQALSYPKQQ